MGLETFQLEALKYKLLPEAQEINIHSLNSSPDIPRSSAIHEVSFSHFAKSKLSGRSVSFWEWFYNLMKLVEKYASRE